MAFYSTLTLRFLLQQMHILMGSRRRGCVSITWSLSELQLYVQYVPARILQTPLLPVRL